MSKKDKVIFNMATMPSRINSMRDTVATILPQCDVLNIYLNEFPSIPEFLKHPKINVLRSQDLAGDIGDVGKFWHWGEVEGYFFTVDDKFNYPADYAKRMIEYIEKYKRKAVFSLHGRHFFTDRPSNSYYFDCKKFFGCLQHHPDDVWVHEIGTGVMAFHTDTVPVDQSIFKFTNMTDIYWSIYLQELGIPMMVVGHKQGYLKIILKHDDRYSIHAHINQRDKFQTETINNYKEWKIRKLDLTTMEVVTEHI